jgi:hypothetical protein
MGLQRKPSKNPTFFAIDEKPNKIKKQKLTPLEFLNKIAA